MAKNAAFARLYKELGGEGGDKKLYRLAKDAEAKPLALQSVPVVSEFPNVFPNELPAAPLMELTYKAVKFWWTDVCKKSFQELKGWLTSTSVLTLPGGLVGYVIYCDASRVGLGNVLMQHEKVIVYASRKLRKHEQNYPTQDLKLAVVVFALKISLYYLNGVHADIFTDHKSLQHIFKQKELNLRQWRWLELLKDYDVDILYHCGKANVVADKLNWKSMVSIRHVKKHKLEMIKYLHWLASLSVLLLDTGNGGVVVRNTVESLLVTELKERQFEDQTLVKIRESIPSQKKQVFRLSEDGVLRYKGQLCVPDVGELQEHIMAEIHRSLYSVHSGVNQDVSQSLATILVVRHEEGYC
uniref:Reverse transcriptase RNase H-like domain-containing protein n=1 Tax=Nicotiana tabacum TaxID=4097 RepID=A0A1S4B8N2_TOBAC|nr:PREDICTED: uncharacterized protein LOC107805649 [Nicotiana tabacum]